MHPLITKTNAGPTRRSQPVLAITVLLGSALAAIVMVGLSVPARATCLTCPKAVNASVSVGQLSSVNYPGGTICIGSDSGTIIDSGFAWLSLTAQGDLVLQSRLRTSFTATGKGSTTALCFNPSDGKLELWTSTAAIWTLGGGGSTSLKIDDRCYLEIYGSTGTWKSSSGGCVGTHAYNSKLSSRDHPDQVACLPADEAGGALLDNGTNYLQFESDGDLVLYNSQGQVWHSDTGGSSGKQLCFDSSAHFKVVNSSGDTKWSADGTGDGKGYKLLLNNCYLQMNEKTATGESMIWKSSKGGC
jgi:hypothetical protein